MYLGAREGALASRGPYLKGGLHLSLLVDGAIRSPADFFFLSEAGWESFWHSTSVGPDPAHFPTAVVYDRITKDATTRLGPGTLDADRITKGDIKGRVAL